MRRFHARTLTRTLFTEQEFTATKFDSAADKAWFANALCRFIDSDFRSAFFTQLLYARLSNCYGHIAHFDRHGFISAFFEDLSGKVRFLEQMLNHPCLGDPTWTYCDVERAVQARLRACDVLALYRARRAAEITGAERALLARLRAKHDAPSTAPPTDLVRGRPVVPTSGRKQSQAGKQASLF